MRGCRWFSCPLLAIALQCWPWTLDVVLFGDAIQDIRIGQPRASDGLGPLTLDSGPTTRRTLDLTLWRSEMQRLVGTHTAL